MTLFNVLTKKHYHGKPSEIPDSIKNDPTCWKQIKTGDFITHIEGGHITYKLLRKRAGLYLNLKCSCGSEATLKIHKSIEEQVIAQYTLDKLSGV